MNNSSASSLDRDVTSALPLTVLLLLLSRPGSVSPALSSQAENSSIEPSSNPFESTPSLSFEKWDEYWRKVHGPRILHADSSEDEVIINKLLRYYQIHRVASGPTSLYPPLYKPPLDEHGQLFDTIIGHVKPYRRPQWDGAAYLNFASSEDVALFSSSERSLKKLGPEGQVMFSNLAPLLTRQFILLPSATDNDAIALVKTHIRRNELDRETFQRRWLQEHAQVVLDQPDTNRLVKRYVQLHNIGPVTPDDPLFHPVASQIDGVSVFAFTSMKDVESFLLSESYARIEEAESNITIPEAGEYWTGVTFPIVDHLTPERTSTLET